MDRSRHDTYILQIWRSRALAGWQWVARVEHLSDGQRHRFGDPEALLAHLRGVALDGADGRGEDVDMSDGSIHEES
jgi:hypothetical protein